MPSKLRFYKAPDEGGQIVGVGTVIEGPTEFKSSRISKKDRRQTLVEEVLHDDQMRNYTKRTFQQIQTEKSKKIKIFSSKKRGRSLKK